ncbi:Phosphopentomutase [Hathewaya proteolytica DSM 3090]|uniref:Phosphopentomutase n=1 Tax=Hathewaya proteolytica DSM 3090 TaxID=1121331 RepID=A0A1M6SLJ7_9CLOT|nr:phosphopentomutase [Hathewaya proteolytica]SHK45573.1 Phosphopentomutase [Hathewaya proteolytica DSM 3090]
MGKAILVVIDSLGIGAMDDVMNEREEDFGANTLLSVIKNNKNLKIPVLEQLGLINALGYSFNGHEKSKHCKYAKCLLRYKGADSFLGHNEIMGLSTQGFGSSPFSVFIDEIRNKLLQCGYTLEVVRKGSASCLVVDENILISDNLEGDKGQLYTVIGAKGCNMDSLKQIGKLVRALVDTPRISLCSCHVEINELKRCIKVVDGAYIGIRASTCSLYSRNYSGTYLIKNLDLEKTSNDKVRSMLQELPEKNIPIALVGKVCDFVDNKNVYKYNEKETDAIEKIALSEIESFGEKLIFINFQETDMAGHLCDANLYGSALEKIDVSIGKIIEKMSQEDLLIVTADHGNDPCIGHSRHTREVVPVMIHNKQEKEQGPIYLGCKNDLSYINELIIDYFNDYI